MQDLAGRELPFIYYQGLKGQLQLENYLGLSDLSE